MAGNVTRANVVNAQAAKAANTSVLALLENIKGAEYRGEALNKLYHRLSYIELKEY